LLAMCPFSGTPAHQGQCAGSRFVEPGNLGTEPGDRRNLGTDGTYPGFFVSNMGGLNKKCIHSADFFARQWWEFGVMAMAPSFTFPHNEHRVVWATSHRSLSHTTNTALCGAPGTLRNLETCETLKPPLRPSRQPARPSPASPSARRRPNVPLPPARAVPVSHRRNWRGKAGSSPAH